MKDLAAKIMSILPTKKELRRKAKNKALSDQRQKSPDTKSSAYFHVNNGGVTFSVVDKGFGPTVVVNSSSFGHDFGQIEVHVRQKDLAVLAGVFNKAAKSKYTDDYCCAARILDQ